MEPVAEGLAHDEVVIADADPAWLVQGATLADHLADVLGPSAVAVEHVGSTSVPGLAAKPILDVVIAVAPDADELVVHDPLVDLGYRYEGDKGADGGLLFVWEDRPGHRTAHVHVVRHGDTTWQLYLAFRTRLRADPALRDAYAAYKRDLAARHADDRAAYTAAKAAFIADAIGPLP
jgi:GrpB-like predicted nucleotidyltransferase (UPF0157 family)